MTYKLLLTGLNNSIRKFDNYLKGTQQRNRMRKTGFLNELAQILLLLQPSKGTLSHCGLKNRYQGNYSDSDLSLKDTRDTVTPTSSFGAPNKALFYNTGYCH